MSKKYLIMNSCYFGVKYCDNCGEELEPSASICKKCGHLLKYRHSKMVKFKKSHHHKSKNPPLDQQKKTIYTFLRMTLVCLKVN
jgi:predicted amidophosphoribosyltransferase